ncbi:MAG TPA: hypothetical protein VN281_07220 [Verrucomicrobiae bacterium]|jgi:hypothetical protein|nr:hypothetical protein [Verrucomicrobiae bacterium]
MSKLGCQCGEVICDNTDDLPYKGYLFADDEFFSLFEPISRDVASYIAARLAGTERKWLEDYFGSDAEKSDVDLVHTIVARYLIHPPMTVYQCEKCGRVHIQHRDQSNFFECFKPEASRYRVIFLK